MNDSPLIVEIKRGSLADGPGLRSVVFFKGCPLRCIFCHSPETQEPGAEIAFSVRQCLRCGRCVEACPQRAVDLERPGRIDRDRCARCGRCCAACPGLALRRIGRHYEVEDLLEVLLRDVPFYRHSHGGVTLSGGECTLYPDYLEPLLRGLKERQIHVALQTCGLFHFETFQQRILPFVDLVYYDVKIAGAELHRIHTGRTNEQILGNLRRLVAQEPAVVRPRIPLIPGLTATRENLRAVIAFLREAGAREVALVPYNPMGVSMYECLGRPKPQVPETFMKPEEEAEIRTMFRTLLAE